MVNCQADDPAAGIFRPVCDTLQNEGNSNSPKQWLGEHTGRLQTSKEAQRSSFNRLSIAYLRLNILEADCSAREGYLRHHCRV